MTPTPATFEVYPSPKRVRVLLGGRVIADSRRALLLRRDDRPPVYYFPPEDLLPELPVSRERTQNLPGLGEARYYNLYSNGGEHADAAWTILRPEPGLDALAHHIAFDWTAMDAWFEEDQEIFAHPRDPRKRIDIAPSSAHVRVHLDGETVAESRRPVLLFETGLVVRYYLPRLELRQELLVPSDRLTYCPYKGEARYYSLRLGDTFLEDLIWYYRYPTAEASQIAGLCCFYQERITVEVDGKPIE